MYSVFEQCKTKTTMDHVWKYLAWEINYLALGIHPEYDANNYSLDGAEALAGRHC